MGGYDEELPSSIDHDLWMLLATHGYHAHGFNEPLVVSLDEFDESMMTDTERRIAGVRAFVEEWRPTYRDWLGPICGERRAQRYVVRVVARLAATKLVTGRHGEARTAIRVIRIESDELLFPVAVVGRQVLEVAI